MMSVMPDLSDRIALVTGASRGGGAAIAAVLGEAGATVYVTGRSSRAGARTEDMPGTVEDAAAEVSARGGTGIGVVCDHTDPAQVEALVARIEADHGRLDVLVNNAWGGYEQYDGAGFTAPFWEQPLERRWESMFGAGVWPTMLTSHRAAPLLSRGGLVACSVAPGFMRTERVMAAHAENPFDLAQTESPEYLGRAIAHLAADPERQARTGEVLAAGDLARVYGFTDVDGSQPEAFTIPA